MKDMIRIDDKNKIYKMLEDKSNELLDILRTNTQSEFILYYKYLTHSDLPTFAKATKPESHSDNLLYYLTEKEMLNIEKERGTNFQTAKQSNISLPKQFWRDIGMKDPRDTVNIEDINSKCINNYADVFLVNEGMKYFKSEYTQRVFTALDKEIKPGRKRHWKFENIDVTLDKNSKFTNIELHHAVHGIGVSQDKEFRKLRHHMFKSDIFMMLIEITSRSKKIYILPYKNPKFFSLINETNVHWESYLKRENERLERDLRITEKEDGKIIDEVTRTQQGKWRNMLAEEMMNYTTNDNEIFCPITYITCSFEELGTLFRASHIKAFADSENHEKYDINNGLLLTANVDALFDKHLITISEQKELLFSFLLDQDQKLKSQLLLDPIIFRDIFNDSRMEYLKEHRKIFFELEEKRKSKNN